MPFDQTKWEALIAILQKMGANGEGKPFRAEYIKAVWGNGAETRYYGSSAYSEVSPFRDVKNYTGGESIEARVMGEPFRKFEINGDIRTENIEITLDDHDGELATLFDDHGAAKVDLYLYWPQVDLNYDAWWGQLLPPQITGRFQQTCVMTNGYRTRELFLPSGPILPEECPAVFGAKMSTADKVATNLCPWDLDVGGSTGIGDFDDCDKTPAGCIERFGHGRFFAGVNLKLTPTWIDNPGNLAHSKGNSGIRNKSATWHFGTKNFRGPDLILMRREPNQQHPDEGFVDTVWRVGKGPLAAISNIKIQEKVIGAQHINIRLGDRGQTPTFYSTNMSNLSGVGHVRARVGPINPFTVTLQSLSMECSISGDNAIAVWTDDVTFTRRWSDDRVWCTVEMYTNQTAGLKYEPGRFWIDDYIFVSDWGRKTVTHSFTFPDGEVHTFLHRRTTFDASLVERPAIDQIVDVCRSGRISVPFQYDGKYAIQAFRVWTDEELDDARVFTDFGPNKNIVSQGPQSVVFEKTRPDVLINEIAFTFEEIGNFDIPRTIYVNDPVAQAAASKVAGDEALAIVKKQYSGLGIRNLNEAVSRARWLMFFGEYDPKTGGGTKNNCLAKVVVPLEWMIGMKKYEPFKLVLESQTIPGGFEWFILLEAVRIDGLNVMITGLAYNKTEMEDFEEESVDPPPTGLCSIDADCPAGYMCRSGVCVRVDPPPICELDFASPPTYNSSTKMLTVPIEPCP